MAPKAGPGAASPALQRAALQKLLRREAKSAWPGLGGGRQTAPRQRQSALFAFLSPKKKKKIEAERGKRGRKVGERWEQSPYLAEKSPKKKKKIKMIIVKDRGKKKKKALRRLRWEDALGPQGRPREPRTEPGSARPGGVSGGSAAPAPPRSRAEPPRRAGSGSGQTGPQSVSP